MDLDEKTVDRIVKHCGFSHMKDNRAVNREETPLTDLFQASQFMRKGVIGDWKNHFSQQQLQTFEHLYQKHMKDVPDLHFCDEVDTAINKFLLKGKHKEDLETSEIIPK